MRALVGEDPQGVHDGLARLGYLPEPDSFDPGALLEHLAGAGGWMLAPGFRRLDPAQVTEIFELGYPPRSPHFAAMRRLSMPPQTLLLRRMELGVLALLGDLNAGGDWGAITARTVILALEEREPTRRRPSRSRGRSGTCRRTPRRAGGCSRCE